MEMITVRVSNSKKLSYMIEFYGISLSDLVKTYSMEQMEDE